MRAGQLAIAGAVLAQAVETAGVCLASVLSAIDTASGKSYEFGSGVALTVIGFGTTAALALVVVGLARARSWSWMPALLTQLFVLIVSIYLVQGHRYDWGGPALALALVGFASLLMPAGLRALGRDLRTPPAA